MPGKTNHSLAQIQRTLRDLKDNIRRDYKADIVGIFGSYARGEQKNGSDVDILVRFSKGASLFDFVALADFLEEKLKVKVDVVSEKALREELRAGIEQEVVAV